jgi:hypothetical protein
MVKLTVLYGHPKDPAHFERYYLETHTPIALRVKGLRRFEIAKVTGHWTVLRRVITGLPIFILTTWRRCRRFCHRPRARRPRPICRILRPAESRC